MTRIPAAGPGATLLALALAAASGCSGGTPPAPPAETDQPHDSLATILAHADGAFRDGALSEAESTYEQALRIDPDNPRAVTNLATCYLKDRQAKRAEEILAAHLGRRPDDIGARLVLARVFIRESQLDHAATALRTVLKVDPGNLVAHYNLGFVAYRSRNYDEAREHLTKAIALKPDHPEAHYTLGLTDLAQGRNEEAITDLEKAVAIEPKHVGAHFNLVSAYVRVGRTKDAERHRAIYADLSGRSKAKVERETQVKTESVKAIRLVLDGKYAEALAEYQTLARRYPDNAGLYHQIGLMQLRLGRKDEALEALKKSIELDPGKSDPHYLLANLYREMGDAAAAERELSIFATLETIPEGKSGY